MEATDLFKFRYNILWAVLLLIVSDFRGYAAVDYVSMKSAYDTVSVSRLRTLGSESVSRMRPDSALFFYSLASSMYSDKLSMEDRRHCAVSTINTGYVWLMMLNNAEMAYPYIMRGIEICRREGFDQYIPIAYDYLAHIYATFGEKEKAWEFYRSSFHMALDRQVWWCLMMCYTDLLSFAWEESRLDELRDEMDTFGNLRLPQIALSRYTINMHRGMVSFLRNDFINARTMFTQAIDANDAESGREHGDVQTRMFVAGTYAAEHDYRNALNVMLDAERKLRLNGFWDLTDNVYGNIEKCYLKIGMNDSARYFRYRGLEIKDSIFNSAHFGKIKDLETAHIVSEMDKNIQRISIERDGHLRLSIVLGTALTAILCLLWWVAVKNNKLRVANSELYRKNSELLDHPVNEITTNNTTSVVSKDNDPKNEILLSKIYGVLKDNREVFDPDFSIERLAVMVGSNPRYVSRAINDGGGCDFRTLVAKIRIREACIRLRQEAFNRKVTIGAIALEVGYRSRTHFTKVFKEITGLTPAEYLYQAKRN